MRKTAYGILLFASLFMLFYPEKYLFLPVSTNWFVILGGIVVTPLFYLNVLRKTPIAAIFLYGTIVFVLGFFAAFLFNSNGDLEVAKRGVLMITYVFSSFFIARLVYKVKGEYDIYELLNFMIYITLFQAIVSFIFYFVPSTYEFYSTLIDYKKDTEEIAAIRLMSIGDTRFATAAVQYGTMMWALILLRHKQYGIVARSKVLYYSSLTLFVMAGILSGRVFFLMIPITLLYLFLLNAKKVGKTVKEFIGIFGPITIVGIFVFLYLLIDNEEMIQWCFELFINYNEGIGFESASTNHLQDMYKFPESTHTWLLGDGKSTYEDGSFYMHTDVGYIRSIYYWGVAGTIIYYLIDYLCIRNFKRVSNDYALNVFVTLILIWLLIYSFKDFYSISKFYVLFTVLVVLSRRTVACGCNS